MPAWPVRARHRSAAPRTSCRRGRRQVDPFEQELQGGFRAPSLVVGPVAGPGEAADGRPRPRPRPRRTSARPASAPCRRPARRSRSRTPRDPRRCAPVRRSPSPSRPGPRPRRAPPGRPRRRRPNPASAGPNRSRSRRGSSALEPGTSVMRSPIRPPVHDSTVTTVRPRAETSLPGGERRARSVREADHPPPLAPLCLFGRRRRREQPGLGHARLAERPERRPVERERRDPRRAGPDLDRVAPGERQRLAVRDAPVRRHRRPGRSCRRPRP